MTSLIGVHHYHLRHHKPHEDSEPVPVETNPATIAADALEAAKGGHVVALHLSDTGEPVMVHPEDGLGDVTQKVEDAMPPPPPAPPGPPPATPPDPAEDQDHAPEGDHPDSADSPSPPRRRGRATSTAATTPETPHEE